MNTAQKAEAWLVKTIDVTDLSDEISSELTDAQEIITALLKEREALLDAAYGVMAIVNESRGVDGWHLNGDVAEWEIFEEVTTLTQAITLCEKEHE